MRFEEPEPTVPPAEAWTEADERTATGDPDRAHQEVLLVDLQGYSGPLDLLLALARTHKIDLSRLSMLVLAEQYLAHVAQARRLRLELAADYLVMAAWLAYLKSRLLLPKEENTEAEPSGEELAAKLAFRLMRLEAMRNAVAQLVTRKQLGVDIFPRGMPEGHHTIREREYTAGIYDLLKAYADQRKRTVRHTPHMVKARKVWSIKDARRQLERLIGRSSGEWVQLDLFLHQYLPSPELGRTAMASSFGATLEMAREGLVELYQAKPFDPIHIRRREDGAEWERLG